MGQQSLEDNLSISTYNIHGYNSTKRNFVLGLLNKYSILIIEEHWLNEKQLCDYLQGIVFMVLQLWIVLRYNRGDLMGELLLYTQTPLEVLLIILELFPSVYVLFFFTDKLYIIIVILCLYASGL